MRGRTATILALAALSIAAVTGPADAEPGGRGGGKGNGGGMGNHGPVGRVKQPWVNPFYPPPKPYPLAIQYPYYYYQRYPTYASPRYPSAVYPVYPAYVDPGYSYVSPAYSVSVDPGQGQWVPAHWQQQWVPTYSSYQVWVPPYYDVNGVLIPGRWEDRLAETGGYYQPVWVEGYWAR